MNNRLLKCVPNSQFVKYVWIGPAEVSHNPIRFVDSPDNLKGDLSGMVSFINPLRLGKKLGSGLTTRT